MEGKHKAFSPVAVLLIIVVTGLIAFSGWYLFRSNSTSTKTKKDDTSSEVITNHTNPLNSFVTLRLVDSIINQPLTNAVVKISSDNGVRCITAPCPTNSRFWQGKTDASAEAKVPKKYIQSNNDVTVVKVNTYTGQFSSSDIKNNFLLVKVRPNALPN